MSKIISKVIIEKIEKSINDDIINLGFEIEYIEYVNEHGNNILRVVIDKGSEVISTGDCEKVSREIENKIDDLVKDEQYILEVSSPGLERQLKNLKLYNKYIGYYICIKLFKKTDILKDVKLKEFEAKLIDVVDGIITVKKNISNIDITFNINIKDIASAHTVFDYDKLLKDNK